jgi:hypothetical protein
VTQPSNAATFVAPASISVMATASDTDGIITRVDFYSGTTLLGSDTMAPYEFTWNNVAAGTYVLSAAATDEDGAHAQSAGVSVTVTNSNAGDIVLHAGTAATRKGTWTVDQDATAASGVLVSHPDRGVPKLETPLGSPTNYFEMTFEADAGRPYRLWMRGRAEANQYSNDSAYVQFSDSVDQSGAPIWRIGTTSATTYVLEDCSGCRLSGWGWQDNGYGVGVLGPLVRFASTGTHTIRVQGREDGLALDQIVLSSVAYVDAAPGSPTNDNTILPSSQAPSGPAPGSREIIIAASAFQARAGTYVTRADATAATGSYVLQPNLGAAKLTSPLPDPQHYVEYEFTPVAGVAYRLWIRGIAENDDWANDSAYVQFSNSVTATGQPTFRIGTSSATTYILEECSGCAMSRWGWEDNGYGSGVLGQVIYFGESRPQRLRIQGREDGLGFDQIVLSTERYFNVAPGPPRNDATIVVR